MNVSKFRKFNGILGIITLVMALFLPTVVAKMAFVFSAQSAIRLAMVVSAVQASAISNLERDAKSLDEASRAKLLSLHGFNDLDALISKKSADIAEVKRMAEDLKPYSEALATYGWPSFIFCVLTLALIIVKLLVDVVLAVSAKFPSKKKDGDVNDAVSVA